MSRVAITCSVTCYIQRSVILKTKNKMSVMGRGSGMAYFPLHYTCNVYVVVGCVAGFLRAGFMKSPCLVKMAD